MSGISYLATGAFSFGEFTFDCASQLLLHAGTERHLSPKAKQLLHLLLSARPRALSREELYDALWPATFVCETNLAGVINEVRRALGDAGRASQFVRTIHGFGYAFRADVAVTASARPPAATMCCEGREHLLFDGKNIVGRAEDCGVVLRDQTVSRRHALILIDDGQVSIKDLGSKNGTFINGERVDVSWYSAGETIGFGAVLAKIVVLKRTSSTTSLKLDISEIRRKVAERMVT